MKKIIFDLDNTIALSGTNKLYEDALPNIELIEKIISYKQLGFEIIISTSRNMRTHNQNLGKINALTLPKVIDWLNKHQVPYDEIYVGKPWCGTDGFYVDDRSIRPSEFINLGYEDILKLINKK